jgi:hypothetical protein
MKNLKTKFLVITTLATALVALSSCGVSGMKPDAVLDAPERLSAQANVEKLSTESNTDKLRGILHHQEYPFPGIAALARGNRSKCSQEGFALKGESGIFDLAYIRANLNSAFEYNICPPHGPNACTDFSRLPSPRARPDSYPNALNDPNYDFISAFAQFAETYANATVDYRWVYNSNGVTRTSTNPPYNPRNQWLDSFPCLDMDSNPATIPLSSWRPEDRTACIGSFIDYHAKRLFRRPVSTEEKSLLLKAYMQSVVGNDLTGRDNRKSGLKGVVALMIQMPAAMMMEHRGNAVANTGQLKLDDHSVATKLAYLLTGSPPDSLLRAAAESKQLTTQPDVLLSHVKRLSAAGSAATNTERKFFSAWLKIDQVSINRSVNAFNKAPENSTTVLDAQERALFQEFKNFTKYAFSANLSFPELMTSTYINIPKDEDGLITSYPHLDPKSYSTIYGLAAHGEGRLDANKYAGILTRAAFLADPSTRTSSIHRGGKIVQYILGMKLPAPPADAGAQAAALVSDPLQYSSRDYTAAITANASCQSCHQFINPAGFAFENFDTMGRHITSERIFSGTSLLRSTPVNAVVTKPFFNPTGGDINGGAQASAALAKNKDAQATFAANLLQYLLMRPLVEDDVCESDIVQSNSTNNSIRLAIEEYLASDAFTTVAK